MCFHTEQTLSAKSLENRFTAKFRQSDNYLPGIYNGFSFPETPVITNKKPDEIQLYQWGLIPFWAKDNGIRKNTLNARIETVRERPSFRGVVSNRCLVLANGFFEWKWLDEKGREKQKFQLALPENEAFAFAGLFSSWTDPTTGEVINSYTILTTVANELMSEIHNSKKRMPIIVSNEKAWLSGEKLEMDNDRLIAVKV